MIDPLSYYEVGPLLLEPKKKYRAEMLATVYPTVTKRNGKYSESEHLSKIAFENNFFREDI